MTIIFRASESVPLQGPFCKAVVMWYYLAIEVAWVLFNKLVHSVSDVQHFAQFAVFYFFSAVSRHISGCM